MQQWLTMVTALAPVVGIIAVGFLARRIDWLTEEADRTLVHLTVRLLLPCFLIGAMNRSEWVPDNTAAAAAPLAGFALTLLGFGVSALVAQTLGPRIGLTSLAHRRTFILCVGMFNYGYIPIPLTKAIFGGGPEMPTLLLHNAGVEIALWTVGLPILAGKLTRRWWLGVLNPVVLSIAIALVLRFSGGWETLSAQAGPVVQMLDWLGQAFIALALLLSGATIADVQRQASLRQNGLATATGVLLRLALIPLLFVLIGAALPTGEALRHVIVIQASMPAAVFPIVLARHYGGDAPTAVRIVLVTHLVCLVTTPVWLAIGL